MPAEATIESLEHLSAEHRDVARETRLLEAREETRRDDIPARIEIREDGDKLIFEGHAAVFDRRSENLGGFVEEIKWGAFGNVLKSDPDVRFFFDHGGLPVARSTIKNGPGMLELREVAKGLRTYSEFAPTSLATDIRTLVKLGVLDQMSFGFRLDPRNGGKDTWSELADGTLLRQIVRFSDLLDVSVVSFPAYTQTDASMRSQVCGTSILDDAGCVVGDRLRDLALRIHRGQQEATVGDRAAIDAAFARIGSASPWWLELSHRAVSEEPEWVAAATKEGDSESGEGAESGSAYRLAARKRRLRAFGNPNALER